MQDIMINVKDHMKGCAIQATTRDKDGVKYGLAFLIEEKGMTYTEFEMKFKELKKALETAMFLGKIK